MDASFQQSFIKPWSNGFGRGERSGRTNTSSRSSHSGIVLLPIEDTDFPAKAGSAFL
jgi:hypothetical protein